MEKVAKSVRSVAASFDKSFGSKSQKQLDAATQKLDRQQEAARKAAREVEGIKRQYDAIASAEITPQSLKRMESELAKVQKAISATEKEYASLEEQLQNVSTLASFEKSASKVISPETATEIQRLTNELDRVGIKWGELEDHADKLQVSISHIKLDPTTSEEAQRLATKLANAQEKSERLAREAATTTDQIRVLTDQAEKLPSAFKIAQSLLDSLVGKLGKMAGVVTAIYGGFKKFNGWIVKTTKNILASNKAASAFSSSIERLGGRIKRLAVAALVFNVLRRGFTQFRNYLSSIIRTNDQFVGSLASIKGNLLTAFQPIWETITPALNAFGAVLAKVTGYLTAFVSLLFGKVSKGSQEAAKGLYDQAKALNAAGSAADKAAGKLAAFDEINTLGADSSGGGGGAEVIYPDFEYDLSVFDDLLNQFETWEERLYDLGFRIGEHISEALDNIDWGKLQASAANIAKSIAAFLNGAVDGINWTTLGNSIGQGVNTALTFVYTFMSSFKWSNLGSSLGEGLNAVFDSVDFDLLGRTFASKWTALVDTLYEFIATFDWPSAGQNVATAVNAWFDEINWSKAAQTISNGIIGLVDSIRGFLGTIEWYQIGNDIRDFLVNLNWGDVVAGIANAFGMALGGLATLLWGFLDEAVFAIGEYFFEKIKDAGGNVALGLLWGILEGLGNVLMWIKEHIFDPFISGFKELFGIHSPSTVMFEFGVFLIRGLANGITSVIETVIQIFVRLWNTVKELTQEAWDAIQEIWSVVAQWFDDNVVTPIADFFGSLWQGIKTGGSLLAEFMRDKVIQPIVDLFKGMYNSVVGIMEGVINAFVGVINGFIRGINAAIETINKIPGVSLSTIATLQQVSVPRLATGAVIPPNQEFLAVLGDQKSGYNIEAPAGLISEIVAEQLNPLYEAVQQLASAISNQDNSAPIVLELDGEVVYRSVKRAERNLGPNLLSGAVPL